MLRSLAELESYRVNASDGDVGKVQDCLFDDERWAVRYLVVETGSFFNERRVLVSPISFARVDAEAHAFELGLTREKIKNSPGVDVGQPITRQHECRHSQYYGYPYYWASTGLWGNGPHPALLGGGDGDDAPSFASDAPDVGDVHLRSAKAVTHYDVQGSDHAVGFVTDLIVDDGTWQIRYLVVDTSRWWGQKVLIATHWATLVSWAQRKVFFKLTREAVRGSPGWDPAVLVRREYEKLLHEHYGLGGDPEEAIKEGPPPLRPPAAHPG